MQKAQQQAFPRPVGAHDDGYATRAQGQVDALDQHRAAGLIGQVLDGQGEQVGAGAAVLCVAEINNVGGAQITHRPAFSPSRSGP